MAEYDANLNEQLGIYDGIIWEQEFGHTGRKVRGNEGYALATEWAQLPDGSEINKHPAAEEFRFLIPQAPAITSLLLCFRVRGVTGKAPSSAEMGPPPLSEKTSGGRYNRPGEHVLYLSDSEYGAIREFCVLDAKGIPYVQQYRLPCHQFKIADFTRIPPDHFVNQVFSKAEECNVEGRRLPGYNFSQTIAELVAAKFDGMRVPGVRGISGRRYSNVIIFCPFPLWPNWLEPGSPPFVSRYNCISHQQFT